MLINKELANKKVPTSFGELEFNEKGESHNLSGANQKHIGEKVRGFTYVEDKAPEKKKEEPKEDDKAEATIVDEDKSAAMDVEEPKKPTRRRTPAKSKK